MSAVGWLTLIAISTTVGFAWCAIGWYFAHAVLREIASCDESCWPQVRLILRQRVRHCQEQGHKNHIGEKP